MKKAMDAKIGQITRDLVEKLEGKPEDSEGRHMYETIRDTFNAFDKDGNAELGWPEYLEAWRFLNQPGTDEEVKKAVLIIQI